MKILLDTNILMLPAQRRLDVFVDIEHLLADERGTPRFFVMQSSVEELASKASGRSHTAIAAKVARIILSQGRVTIVKSLLPKTDEAILDWANMELSEHKEFAVVTNDVALRKKLRAMGTRLICLKGGTRLDWC